MGRPRIPQVLNIPPEFSFVDVLAKELLRRHGATPGELSTVTILTTTRRAARALQQSFLRETEGRPLMLPAMRPIGDVDEDELLLEADFNFEDIGEKILGLPPAIEPLRRQLLLSRLIDARADGNTTIGQSVGLARELARLLDQVQTEGLDLKSLVDLVPEEYAAHWQITLEFLEIISSAWPELLKEEGCIDPALRRDLLLHEQSEYWTKFPPNGPVYAVGSTGSIPATASLLKTVSMLPKGCVVLPGLDRHLDQASWELVKEDPTHAQYGLANLLSRLKLDRDDVADLQDEAARSVITARARFLSEALRPAASTELWQKARPPIAESLSNIRKFDCLDPQAEAQAISLLLRETLETPAKTAVLITPDRDLSRRVCAELLRWGVEVDDSAGTSLDQSPPGVFLRLVARMIADKAAPISFLAAMKHPLATFQETPEKFRRHVRELEMGVLRGPAPDTGLDGIARALKNVSGEGKSSFSKEIFHWFDGLLVAGEEIFQLSRRKEVDFADFLKVYFRFAEKLSTPAESDNSLLWEGTFGDAAANFTSELLRAAPVMGSVSPAAWPELLDNLMTGRMVRRKFGQHPRLQIWGPLEGRLQRADLIVLGGLNEGVWPPETGSDPWMSRPMRKDFKLPLPERRIGLSAHDFQQAFCGKEVVLTRAEKIDGTPTVPSRWLLRIETLLKKFELKLGGADDIGVLAWQRLLDQPDAYEPCFAPRPTPPVTARPRRLSVTRIEKWIKDPYSIFADAILKVRPLADIAEDPGAADRGNFIHAALEKFVRSYPDAMPLDAEAKLLEIGRETFGDVLSYPAVWAFWWPRFEKIAHWFVEFETVRRLNYRTLKVEVKGEIKIPAPYADFILSGTADRIDRHKDGTISVLDYKTGSIPSIKEVETGVAPQLALEAAMIARHGFSGIDIDPVTELAFVKVTGGDPPGSLRSAGKDMSVDELANAAYEGLQRLIILFDKQATPYLCRPRPDLYGRYNDYEHLARIKEWSSGESSE
ncbi:double-strand break repair protein AddB [Sneathiella marina]|uniref:Double-strand break repair protein AddB n=1 Tax=Sneathiella marina TaxID=2950108 RepID=A0ABY4W339_9PROT|nr:double-strand break repair protein AddB [Sneathiella marina]USG61329.1 double-strand break repair protein AddB [Sneathiella marina]